MSLEDFEVAIIIALIFLAAIFLMLMFLFGYIRFYIHNGEKLEKAESDILFYKSQMNYYINELEKANKKIKELEKVDIYKMTSQDIFNEMFRKSLNNKEVKKCTYETDISNEKKL